METITMKQDLLESLMAREVKQFITKAKWIHHADLADIYEDQSEEDREFFAVTLGPEKFSGVIIYLPDTIMEQALNFYNEDEQRQILTLVSDDNRVDILQDLSDEAQLKFLALLGPDDYAVTQLLLSFPEDTAGGRMTTQIGKIDISMTVKEAEDSLRESYMNTENLSRIYVTDSQNHLKGRIRFRDLAFSKWKTPIREIYKPCEHTILVTADQEEVAIMFSKYDLIMLPVVDESGHLMGIITHDDAMEIMAEESREDMEKMAGFSGEASEGSYLNVSTTQHFKRRFPWLICLAFLSIASGYVILQFEEEMSAFFMLALFLPMVVDAGGNTGGQSSVMVVRAIALGELNSENTLRILGKELVVGLMLGSMLGLSIALLTAYVLPLIFGVDALPADISYLLFGTSVAMALTCQITSSTLLGATIPMIAQKFKVDPAVLAAPAITTIVDVSGMAIYFSVAKFMLL